jgi:Fe-S cluster biosynthesis and repair protein YggX
MPRTVFCVKEQRETEGLDFVPWPGALGQRVFASIGKPAWAAWLAHQTMLINENRLSPLDKKHRAFLEEEMQKFLFGEGSAPPPGYAPPTPGDGRNEKS